MSMSRWYGIRKDNSDVHDHQEELRAALLHSLGLSIQARASRILIGIPCSTSSGAHHPPIDTYIFFITSCSISMASACCLYQFPYYRSSNFTRARVESMATNSLMWRGNRRRQRSCPRKVLTTPLPPPSNWHQRLQLCLNHAASQNGVRDAM